MAKINVQALKARIENMTSADQLRLAAELLDHGDADTASVLVQRVHDDLALMKLMRSR